MAVFEVPPSALQAAVDAALVWGDGIQYIDLTDSPVPISERVTIGPADPAWLDWKLIIRPQPGIRRATIASSSSSETIFSIGPNARDVTFQDLDIIRHAINRADLIEISSGTRITFDRCRIGSDWISAGSPGWDMLTMTYPIDILVRNCIFFSHMAGNFDRGIRAQYGDESNVLRLYNNVIADYRRYGIDIASVHDDSRVLLRNNVVINRPGMVPQPFAYHSNVVADVDVFSSHNVAFAGVGNVEDIDGAQPIAGPGPSFVRLARNVATLTATFVDHTWNVAPLWAPNPNFYRLLPAGPLHIPPIRWGVIVNDVAPDIAVNCDIELDIRPSGAPPHTDRGADQIRHPSA